VGKLLKQQGLLQTTADKCVWVSYNRPAAISSLRLMSMWMTF
jgi:hypothetical protein